MAIVSQLSQTDIVVFTFAIIIFIGLLTLIKIKVKYSNIIDYLSMGRTLTLPAFIVTLVSSWYGSVLGATQIAYKYGIFKFFALGVFWYVSALIFAFFISGKIFKENTMSLPELIGKIYGVNSEKLMLIMMIIKSLPVAYLMALIILITNIFGLHVNYAIAIVGLIAFVVSLRASLKSVVIIDIIQFLTIFAGMAAVIYYCFKNLGGYKYLSANLPEEHLTINGFNDYQKIALCFLIAFSTTVMSPIFHQRCIAANSKKTARWGIVFSVGFWVISDLLTTLGGLYARAKLGEGHDEDGYLQLITEVLPEGLVGYLIAAIFIAAISALDSYLFATKSLIINYCNNKGIILTKFLYVVINFAIITIALIVSVNLNGDFERAWLLFKSAFIASLLFPTIFSLYFTNSISSFQFNILVTSTFFTVLIMDYYYLPIGTTVCLKALFINIILTLFCAGFQKLKLRILKNRI